MLLLKGRNQGATLVEKKQNFVDFCMSKAAASHACSRVRDGTSIFNKKDHQVISYRQQISSFINSDQFTEFFEKVIFFFWVDNFCRMMNRIFLLKLTDASYVFNLLTAFPTRLCLSTKAEVLQAVNEFQSKNVNGDVNGLLVKNRAETAHLRRFEKATSQLLGLLREGKVKKSDVRRSKVYQELLKLLVRKRSPRPKQAAPKRIITRRTKRIFRHLRPTEEPVEEVAAAEPMEIADHPSNVSSMLDDQMNLEEESDPQLRVSKWGLTEFGGGSNGEVTPRPLRSSTPQL